MKTIFLATVLGIGLLVSAGVSAADAPAGATALCEDGTYYTNATHKGACKGHQGVKTWLDTSSDAAPAAAKPSTTAAASKPAATKAAPTKTAAAPSDSTGTPIAKCKDGTTFSGTSHRGACRGHKGVDTWLDQPATAATPTAATPAKPAATPAAPAKTATADAAPKTPTPSSQIQQKAGGGPGMVWVNSGTKVYHCSDDQWYGKTKDGSYMTEAAAKSGGNRAARGKECGS